MPKTLKFKLLETLRLSFYLAKINFKLRNENSYLGLLWYLIEPLFSFLILYMVFASHNQGIPHYPVYILFGSIIFNFFSSTISGAITVLKRNANVIKSYNLNKSALVLSLVIQFIFSHLIELIPLIGLMIYLKISVLPLLFFYPPLLFMLTLFIVGITYIFAVLGVFITDLQNVWRVASKLIWLSTPIFYSVTAELFFVKFNPLYYFLELGRSVIIYRTIPNNTVLLITVAQSLIFFALGLYVFHLFKGRVAENL